MNIETRLRKFRERSGSALILVIGLLLVGSAAAKFAPKPAAQMAILGFAGSRLLLISLLEATSAIVFMIPRSRSAGLLLISAYLGGAIAAHVGHGQFLASLRPAVFLAMLWTAVWLRNPEMLWSFAVGGSAANPAMEKTGFRQVAREV